MKRILLSILILTFQLCALVYARFVPTHYFSWAPYDTITTYSINVKLEEQTLTDDAIQQRYHIPNGGQENLSIAHIKQIIQQYELADGKKDKSRVTLRYRVNGKNEVHWIWID